MAGILAGIEGAVGMLPAVEQVWNALAPEVQTLINSLPTAAQSVAKPMASAVAGTGIQAAYVKRLTTALPGLSAATITGMFTTVGTAVAEAVTAEELATTPEATDIYLCSTAAKTTIEGLINTAFAAEGINVSLIRPSTLSGMIDNGIEMYMAGIGVQALKA